MTQVVIDDIIPRTQIIASSGQTVFNTNWTADATTDIDVYRRADGEDADDATQIVSQSLYNVTFIGASQTVRVTFLSGVTLDDIITIVRNTPAERTNLYINTNFVPSMLNQDFGILTLVDQQAQMYDTVVNPGYNVSATIDTKDKILPILGANQIWAMNPTNTLIIPYNVPAGGGLAPGDAKYLLQQADADLPNAQSMGALATGLVVNTTTTGVQRTRILTGVATQTVVTNGSGLAGNPTVGFADNAIFPGVEGLGLPEGTTAQRPDTPVGTNFRFNTDLIILEYWDGSNWAQLSETDGVVAAIGTEDQVLVNNSFGVPVDGAITLTLSSTLDVPGTFNIQGTTAVDEIINDDTLATASSTNLATALSIKNYIDNTAAGIVNTGNINELAWYAANGAEVSGLTTANNGILITSTLGVPSISSTLPTAVQSNITQLGAQVAALNMSTHLINNVVDPISPQDAATKNYVDQTALTGTSVYAATTSNLSATQSGAGVGATLTDNSGTFAAFSLDGVSPPLNSNVLVKDYANAANEGIYTLTTNGDGVSIPWVLTRAMSYNTAAEINNTGLIVIQNGSTLSGQAWYNTTTIVTVDTTAFSFSRFGTQGTVTSVGTAGLATGGPITNTGTVTVPAATQANQEAGTSTTTAVTPSVQQFHPSAAKMGAWVAFTAGIPAIVGSYNVASITDSGTGVTIVTETNAMTFGTVMVGASLRGNESGGGGIGAINAYTQSAFPARVNVQTFDVTGTTPTDVDFSVLAIGDLA